MILFGFGIITAQSKSEKRALKKEVSIAAYNEMKELIESGKFQFEASWAFPLGNDITKINFSGGNNIFQGNRINLIGNTNYIKLNYEFANISLPYFGQVYRVTSYNNRDDNGFEFKNNIEDLKITYKDSKRRIDVKFITNKSQESLQIHLIINAKGNTYLTVNSSNRESIRYQGRVVALKEIEKKIASN